MAYRHRYEGHCHCGNVEVVFETDIARDGLDVRACGCAFCRQHGARTTTDPAGRAHVRIADAGKLSRYRFGLKTADFLVCRACGAYVGAFFEADGRGYATLNINAFAALRSIERNARSVDYEQEGADDRLARRRARWTPAMLEGGAG